MAVNEEFGRFLVDLAGGVSNESKKGMEDVGKDFSTQLANLSTIISAQGVSQIVGVFYWDPTKFRDWIKSTEKYVLLSSGDDTLTKWLAFQTSQSAVCDYIHRYITENSDNKWEQLKAELNARFAEICDPHHAFTMLRKSRQTKHETVQVYAEQLYTFAHDAFAKLDKTVVKSESVGFFIDGLYHDYLHMKIMRENPKSFQMQSSLLWQNKI